MNTYPNSQNTFASFPNDRTSTLPTQFQGPVVESPEPHQAPPKVEPNAPPGGIVSEQM
jgi:hypothetical protein